MISTEVPFFSGTRSSDREERGARDSSLGVTLSRGNRQYLAMAARLRHLQGDMEPATVDKLQSLLDELDLADDEHTDVSVSDESEWTLSAFRSGLLVWENVAEDEEPQHMKGLPRPEVLRHFTSLVLGDLAAIRSLPWSPGYG